MLSTDKIEAIIEWDIINWKKALEYWQEGLNEMPNDKTFECLELGGRRGGPSLWLALNGHSVVCSDLENPEKYARNLHERFDVSRNIKYEAINALEIPYSNQFDIVIFKSILGGISREGRDELKKNIIDGIYESLKPGGTLFFAENLESTFLHRFARKYFVKWGGKWNYLKYKEIPVVFSSFDTVSYDSVGFLAAFGRSEKQRQFLGKFDRFIKFLTPKSRRYVAYGIAKKRDD